MSARPAESKQYAFFQNLCALLFIIAIIVRAVMALAQAQNQIETRSGTENCHNLPPIEDLRIVVRHKMNSLRSQTGQAIGYDTGMQVTQGTRQAAHFSDATYTVTIRSTNTTSLDAVRLPDIWFTNAADTFHDTTSYKPEDFMSSFAPWLVPPWQMIGGKHIEGNIGLLERRFITSSVFRDIVANLRPTYNFVSLFTISVMTTV
ncbi:hypothetical protein FRC07_003287 [Ceratobasidium sp. 392]|nr:hypothetical protein FRC07_003287 [Ceratobasidium sp. 392]